MATVADIMSSDVLTIPPEMSVRDIARLLCSKRISGVPVVDTSGALVGIVSESDLMVHAAAIGDVDAPHRSWWKSLFVNNAALARDYAKTHGQTAEHVMSTHVLTIHTNEPVANVARVMGRYKIKRLPVLDEGRLVGIVTRADLLKILAGSAPSRAGAPSDDAILDALLATLHEQPWTRLSAKNIQVQDGVVHLAGSVKSEEERQAIQVAAESISGVTVVENQLVPDMVLPIV